MALLKWKPKVTWFTLYHHLRKRNQISMALKMNLIENIWEIHLNNVLHIQCTHIVSRTIKCS